MISLAQVRDALGVIGKITKRTLDDQTVYSQTWPTDTGVQQALEQQGYAVRWHRRDRLHEAFAAGWEYVMIPHYKWWRRRVRLSDRLADLYLVRRRR